MLSLVFTLSIALSSIGLNVFEHNASIDIHCVLTLRYVNNIFPSHIMVCAQYTDSSPIDLVFSHRHLVLYNTISRMSFVVGHFVYFVASL